MDTKQICLSLGKVAIVDESDFAFLSQWKWCAHRGENGLWYAVRYDHGPILMHRVLLGLERGSGKEVDHRNHDTLDNRRSNIRICTRTQNQQNRSGWIRKDSKKPSRFKGVFWDQRRGQWNTQIRVNKRKIQKGFNDEAAAAHHYDELAKLYFGEFALLNFGETVTREPICSV